MQRDIAHGRVDSASGSTAFQQLVYEIPDPRAIPSTLRGRKKLSKIQRASE